MDVTKESVFKNDIIAQMLANRWLLGSGDQYQPETALSCQTDTPMLRQSGTGLSFCITLVVYSDKQDICTMKDLPPVFSLCLTLPGAALLPSAPNTVQ